MVMQTTPLALSSSVFPAVQGSPAINSVFIRSIKLASLILQKYICIVYEALWDWALEKDLTVNNPLVKCKSYKELKILFLALMLQE